MIRFARFNNGGQRTAINPRSVTTVLANGSTCKVFTVETANAMDIIGSFDEVVAALESATAPPIAAAVEVAPTDLEMAAQVLEVVASEIDDDELEHLAARVNNKIGTRYDTTPRDGAICRLQALAAKLRGGG